MIDRHGIEILPDRFSGEGKYKNCKYKCMKGTYEIRLYAVFHGDDEEHVMSDDIHYEVAVITVVEPIISGLRYFEHYPTDKLLGKKLWRFDNEYEALEFYNSKVL
jgi:hypothetical protein